MQNYLALLNKKINNQMLLPITQVFKYIIYLFLDAIHF